MGVGTDGVLEWTVVRIGMRRLDTEIALTPPDREGLIDAPRRLLLHRHTLDCLGW